MRWRTRRLIHAEVGAVHLAGWPFPGRYLVEVERLDETSHRRMIRDQAGRAVAVVHDSLTVY